MELRHLRYFVAIAEALNFSRAAERLRVSQPALSRQMQDLELEVGTPLFLRGRQGVTLTAAGRTFLAGARRVLAAQEALLARLQVRLAGEKPPLRITHFGTLVAQVMSPALRKLIQRLPGVRLVIEEDLPAQALKAVRARRIDAAMTGEPSPAQLRGLEHRVVWMARQEILLPSNHPLAKRRRIPLAALRDEPWAMWSEAQFPGFGGAFRRGCRSAGFRPRIVASTDSLSSTLIHVAEGDYITHVPPTARQFPHPGVAFVPLEPAEALDMPVLLVWCPESPHAADLEWLAETMVETQRRTAGGRS